MKSIALSSIAALLGSGSVSALGSAAQSVQIRQAPSLNSKALNSKTLSSNALNSNSRIPTGLP